jgi:hypothetical protein
MPLYNILGLEIFIPSLDEIINAVLAPISDLVNGVAGWIYDSLTPLFSNVINTLGPLFSGVTSAIIDFLSDPLGSLLNGVGFISGAVAGLPDLINGGLNALGSGLNGSINALESGLTEFIGGAEEFLGGAINALGADLSGAIGGAEEFLNGAINSVGSGLYVLVSDVSNGITGAIAFMENSIGGALSGLFSNFGVGPSAEFEAITAASHAAFSTGFAVLFAHHSAIEPGEVLGRALDYREGQNQTFYNMAVTANLLEAVSLGQVDAQFSSYMMVPKIAASQQFVTQLYMEEAEIATMVAFRRALNAAYVPMLPQYADLIQIYVKEGYLESHWVEMPPEMAQNFKELGYSEYWSQRLWGMHWQYPGASQLFEMLHRTAGNFPEIGVSDEVLYDMLKLHDYEPKWRGPLAAISWNTWRIYDIRTGWEMDLLDDDGMVKRLIDTGYLPADATVLAEVQKMFVLRSEIDGLLTEADTDYTAGWIDEEQLKANYDATPYNEGVKTLRVARARSKRERSIKTDLLAALENRFIKGDLSQPEFELALSNLGMIQTAIASEVEVQLAKKLTKVKEETVTTAKPLTEATYSKAFRVGLIPEEEYRVDLAALKFSAEDTDLLVQLNTPEKPSPDVVKTLTVAELKAAFRVGVLSEEDFKAELAARKYSDTDINTIVKTEKAKIKPKTAEAG